MTVITSRTGAIPRARRLLGRLAAALVVAGVSVTTLAFGPAAVADDDASTAPDEPGIVELHVSAGPHGVLGTDASLLTSLTISNHTDAALRPGSVQVELAPAALSDIAAVDAWLDAGVTDGAFQTLVTQPTGEVEPDAENATSAFIAREDLPDLAPGAYALRATLTTLTESEDQTKTVRATASTVITVSDDPLPRVTVLVPITATPADGVMLDADELAELTAPDGALTAQLDGVVGMGAIIAVDPAIAASIRMLGDAAPESARTWLERLEELPNDRFALQFGDADAAVQAHAGLDLPLEPGPLAPLIAATEFVSSSPSPSPAKGTDAVEPELPGNDELTGIRGAGQRVLWPRGDVTDADLDSFADYFGDQVLTVLPSTSVDGTGDAPGHGAVGEHSVLVTDADLSARLSAAAEEEDAPARERELAAASAHLSFLPSSSPIVVGLERSETRSAAALRAALSAFAASGSRLAELTQEPAAAVGLTSAPDDDRVVALKRLLADRDKLTSFSSILDEPALMLSPESVRIMRTIAVGLSDEDFGSSYAEHLAATMRTLDAVGIQEPSPVQLFTAAAPLPVWVRNDLPWPVNLSLSSQPSDPRLDVTPRTEVVADALGNTRVSVPIEARVASGDVQVEFRLYSPSGVPIGAPEVGDVTLRADWEGIGLGVLGTIIVLLIGVGTVRTVLRRRRARATS